MTKSSLLIILGNDNVGKSTYIRNNYFYCKSLHFDKPKPDQPTWHSDYDRIFDSTDLLVCDRGYPEAHLYQQIDKNLIIGYHKKVCEVFNVEFELIEHDWDFELENRHYRELVSWHPDASEWWLSWQLKKRYNEHIQYYKVIKPLINELRKTC